MSLQKFYFLQIINILCLWVFLWYWLVVGTSRHISAWWLQVLLSSPTKYSTGVKMSQKTLITEHVHGFKKLLILTKYAVVFCWLSSNCAVLLMDFFRKFGKDRIKLVRVRERKHWFPTRLDVHHSCSNNTSH